MLLMAEIVDWQHIDEHHPFQTVETWTSDNTGSPPVTCWVCGKTADNHWFPKTDLAMKAALLNQIDDIAKEAWNNA
jgi:hypothetical protein